MCKRIGCIKERSLLYSNFFSWKSLETFWLRTTKAPLYSNFENPFWSCTLGPTYIIDVFILTYFELKFYAAITNLFIDSKLDIKIHSETFISMHLRFFPPNFLITLRLIYRRISHKIVKYKVWFYRKVLNCALRKCSYPCSWVLALQSLQEFFLLIFCAHLVVWSGYYELQMLQAHFLAIT